MGKWKNALLMAGVAAGPAFAQFGGLTNAGAGGPSSLLRGEAPAGMATSQIDFRPFFELGATYDTGLAGVAVDSAGNLANIASYGLQFTGGVSGLHSWRHTRLGVDYRGTMNHRSRSSYYDGFDQSLMLGVSHQLSRHTMVTVRESAGQFSRGRGFAGLQQTVPFDPSSSYIPQTDFYDNRTMYLSTQADFTVQKSLRLSYNIGGDAFLARRRSSALYGVTGAGARGDVQYRLTRRSTIGAGYNYTHYAFHGAFGATDLHGVMVSYGIQATRRLEFTGVFGAMRAETKFLRSRPIDPAVAAVIGMSAGAVVSHGIDYVPTYSGRLSRSFERGVAYISGGRSMTPGNGLFLTTAMTTATAGYTYTGLRYWSLNVGASYAHGKSLGNVRGYYGGVSGHLSASRKIASSLHAVVSFDARQYQSGDFAGYNRLIYTARIGLGFTPGAIPLRMW